MGRANSGSKKYGVKLVRGPFLRLQPHEHSVTTEAELRKVVKRLDGPVAADLFCGAGGLSLGLEAAGYNVILGVDHDEDALETHAAYHPGLSTNLDLADPAVVERVGALLGDLGVDLIAGGPPCQPFSRAGRAGMRDLVRRGVRPSHDMRRELWQSFLRIVSIAKPQAVLMENVPDMALDRNMWIVRTMVDELENLGYSAQARVVTTSEYGVPQQRQRLFLVALADGVHFSWPERQEGVVTVRNAIGELPVVEGGWRPDNGDDPEDRVASGWLEYPGAATEFQSAMRAGVPRSQSNRIYDHITRPVREDDAEAFAQMGPDTKYSDLAPELRRYRSDIFDDKYKRLDWNGLSRTIVAHIAKDGYWYIHPDQPRTITVREAARIQTFPDHVRFAGSPPSAFKQIGNAVPPRMAEVLGSSILASLEKGESEQIHTGEIAAVLASWFADREQLALPWLRASNRWQVISAEILWSRIARDQVRSAWSLIAPLETPAETLRNLKVIEIAARRVDRQDRVAALERAAKWFEANPAALNGNATAEQLREAPEVSKAIADLAVRICPGEADDRDDPVLVTNGILRVAARFFGDDVEDNQNKYSDGRLAEARMIGGDDASHDAHRGLFELAASLCAPASPLCGSCPLVDHCAEAEQSSYQLGLGLTTPSA